MNSGGSEVFKLRNVLKEEAKEEKKPSNVSSIMHWMGICEGKMLSLQGGLLPLFRLADLFSIDESDGDSTSSELAVVRAEQKADANRYIGAGRRCLRLG